MSIGMNSAMRAGIVSKKAAAKYKKPAILNQTRAQPSKMAAFDGKSKDEGTRAGRGQFKSKEINRGDYQSGSNMSKGAQVGSSYVPGRKQIDQFPQKQGKKFPAAAEVRGSGSAKVGVTAKRPGSSGGSGGGDANNKHYYGGPSTREREQ